MYLNEVTTRQYQRGRTIIFRADYSPKKAEFLRNIPGATFHKTDNGWILPGTPGIVAHCRKHFGADLQLDQACYEMYEKFLALPRAAAMRDSDIHEQPVLRRSDSWAHQCRGYQFVRNAYASMLNAWMGTGKTKMLVDVICNNNLKKVLIVCPKSVLGVWEREVAAWASVPARTCIVPWLSSSIAKQLEGVEAFIKGSGIRIVVINYDKARSTLYKAWIMSQSWDAVIGDESHKFKGGKLTAKVMWDIGGRSGSRHCLTGTMMPHSPMDLYAQFRFLDPSIFGGNLYDFQRKYAIMDKMFTSRVLDWINQEEMTQRIAPYTIEIKSDVLTLPPVLHEQIDVEINARSRKVYDDLEAESVAEIHAGTVTAANALVKFLRLQQVSCGYIGDCDLGIVEQLGADKEDALYDLIEGVDPSECVVVCCRFTPDIEAVRRVADTLGRTYRELSGDRHELTRDAKIPNGTQVFGFNEASGGVGVDMTLARYCVLYSLNFSLGDYDQMLARTCRPGQTKPVTYYHLTALNTIDQTIYKSLRDKRNVVESVMEYLRNV